MRAICVASILLAVTLAPACRGKVQPSHETSAAARSSAPEKSGPIHGRIISRDGARNEITLEGETAAEIMEAMTMPYEVRGAKVASLPPDGTRVRATIHVRDDVVWLTDVTPEK